MESESYANDHNPLFPCFDFHGCPGRSTEKQPVKPVNCYRVDSPSGYNSQLSKYFKSTINSELRGISRDCSISGRFFYYLRNLFVLSSKN